jgi:lantibiotic transport system permease protein
MENDFEKKMENIETPNAEHMKHQEPLKIGFASAQKSAKIGIWMVAIPIIIVVIAYIKISFLIHMNFYSNIQEYLSGQDKSVFFGWINPLFLLGLPLLAIFINILAITYFSINKTTKELTITIRYRFRNLIVIIISAILIVATFWHVILMHKF